MSVVDNAYKRVSVNKEKWATLPLQRKLDYLIELKQIHETLIDEWGKLCCEVRGYPSNDYIGLTVGYFNPMATSGALACLVQTYKELVENGKPRDPIAIRTVGDQQVLDVFPYWRLDKILYAGCKLEFFLEPGKSVERAANLKNKVSPICAILGAGNFEGPSDILTKLFVDNALVVYKPNPVNESVQTAMLPKLFASLIRDGFVEIVVGGSEVGTQLLAHPLCDEALMTGGAATYDRIVWGPNPAEAKKTGKKLFNKKFEAELGAVSPYILVPGEWTEAELQHHASLLVVFKIMNGGAICASPQVYFVDKDWPQRQRFNDLVREKFRNIPNFLQYYPGFAQRCANAKGGNQKFEEFVRTSSTDKSVNPIVFFDYPAGAELHHTEAFAPILCEFAVPTGNNVEAFLKYTLDYVNSNNLFGSLSCSVMVDPRTQSKYESQIENFINRLEYGSIALNNWGGLLAALSPALWGAYPKHTPEDIQSGTGKLGNWLLVSNVQKSVFRSPFVSPGHLTMPDKYMPEVVRRGAYLSSEPGFLRFLNVLSAKLLGW